MTLSYAEAKQDQLRRLQELYVQEADLRFLLRPQQREIHAWLNNHKQIVSVVHAARGYGKTWLALVLALEAALRHTNQRILFACPTREQARQIAVPTMGMLQEKLKGILHVKTQSTGHQYVLENGSTIILEGADDDRGNHLRGPHAHLIICDEAGFWRHCDYVVRSVLLPQAQRCSGRLIAISTSPESVGHEFVALCERAKRSGSYLRRTIDDNKHISAEEKAQFIEELGGINATATKRELYCEFVVEENRAVIPEFDVSRHVKPEDPSMPIWRDRYVALDLGFIDNNHALFGWWDFDNARLVVEDEVMINYAKVTDLVESIKAKEKAIWGEKPVYMRISDNDPQIIYDMAQNGLPFAPAIKNDKEAAINSLRTMFARDKIVINPRCQNLIHQLTVGIWNKQRTDYERLPGAGHLDGVDALVYLHRSIDRNHNPTPVNYGYQVDTHYIPKTHQKPNKKLLAIVGRH